MSSEDEIVGDKCEKEGIENKSTEDENNIETTKSTSVHTKNNIELSSNEGGSDYCDQSELSPNVVLKKNTLTVDNQVSLEGMLGLVDEIESQVECFREKIKSMEGEKSSLQETLHFITQLVSDQDCSVKTGSCISTNDISELSKGKLPTKPI